METQALIPPRRKRRQRLAKWLFLLTCVIICEWFGVQVKAFPHPENRSKKHPLNAKTRVAEVDPNYGTFLQDVLREAKRRRSRASTAQLTRFAETTWDGCEANPWNSYVCLAISCDECGLSPLDNPEGFGWLGGTWHTIQCILRRSLGRKPSKEWIRSHPDEVNRAMAAELDYRILAKGQTVTLKCWNRGGLWRVYPVEAKRAWRYVWAVDHIFEQITGVTCFEQLTGINPECEN